MVEKVILLEAKEKDILEHSELRELLEASQKLRNASRDLLRAHSSLTPGKPVLEDIIRNLDDKTGAMHNLKEAFSRSGVIIDISISLQTATKAVNLNKDVLEKIRSIDQTIQSINIGLKGVIAGIRQPEGFMEAAQKINQYINELHWLINAGLRIITEIRQIRSIDSKASAGDAENLKEGGIINATNEYRLRNDVGWKIHLGVEQKNRREVYRWLLQNCPYTCKYGHASGQKGKDFTIYVGSFDAMLQFALKLTQVIGHLLSEPSEDALDDDAIITPKISARFDVTHSMGRPFHQYGHWGLPYLEKDTLFVSHHPVEFKKIQSRFAYIRQFIDRAYSELNRRYGTYFRGSGNQVAKYVAEILNSNSYYPPRMPLN